MGVREKYKRLKPLPADWAERLGRLAPVFRRHGVRLAYLFGSAAGGFPFGRGDRAPGDLDLAYLPGPGFRFRPFYADLSSTLGTDRLDLVDLRRAQPGLLYEIVSKGRVLYRESGEVENSFELAALARFREEAVRLARWAALARG